MKNLHNAIANYLTGKASIKEVKVYNRQPENPQFHKLFKSPCVFLEMSVAEIQSGTQYGQLWTVDVAFHVCVMRKDGDKPDFYDVPSSVIEVMSGIGFEETVTVNNTPETRPITRYPLRPIDWNVDHDHDNVIDNVITFRCSYYFNNNPVQNALTDWVTDPTATIVQTITFD